MRVPGRLQLLGLVVAAAAAFWYWKAAAASPEREIEAVLHELAAELNAATTDGAGTAVRAARLADFFTADVLVDLGQGSPTIQGREMLIGMAARMQPRTAAFTLEFDDLTVRLLDDSRAEVTLAALVRRRSFVSGEESLDAREFSAEVRREGDRWRVSRAAAIDILR